MRGPRLSSAPEDSERGRWVSSVVALLLATLFVLEATSIRGKDLTYDAPDHLRYGERITHGDATRFDDSKMPVSAWNALPRRIAEELEPGPLRDFLAADSTARYPTMLASLVLAWLVFRWSRELYGALAGLLALFLYVFDPNLLAHSRYVTTDLYCVLTITLSLYTFWRFLTASPPSPSAPPRSIEPGADRGEGRPHPTLSLRHGGRPAWGLAAALAFGLAQIAKYTGAYLVPVLLLVAAVRFAPEIAAELRRRRFGAIGRRAALLAGWATVFLVAMILVVNVGFLFQDPFWPLAEFPFRSEPFQEMRDRVTAVWPGASLPFPYPYVEGLDWVLARERTGEGYGNIYLLGETRTGEGFPGYFFVVTFFKQPLPTLIAWLAALLSYGVLWRRGVFRRFARDEAFLLVPAAFFTVYFNFFFQAQMGIRYFLPVFPLLHVFAGCLLAPRVLERQGLPRRKLAAAGAFLGAWLVASVLSYYPHLLPYTNELMIDRKMAYRVFADSNLAWGEDVSYVERYVEEHPEVVWQPEEPTAGRILVGTNWLTGVFKRRRDTWIRDRFEPVDHLRYSHLLFEISEEEAERARREMAAARGEPGGAEAAQPPR